MASLIAVGLLVGACGGGGGGDATKEPAQGITVPDASQPLVDNGDAFLFRVGPELASDQALDRLAGGSFLFPSWNPAGGQMLTPGMKVSFFGRADGCDVDLSNGPVRTSTSAPDSTTLSRMALAQPQAGFLRDWQPAGQSQKCAADARTAVGPSRVVVNADTGGGVGLYTTADGTSETKPFFGPYDAGGQNGTGANAYNTSSFVTFRMDWRQLPRRPWVPSAAAQGSVARIYTRQSVGSAAVSAPANASLPVQAKQFLAAAFINNACASEGITAARPCLVKYLLPLAVTEAGVQDWTQVGWFTKARVWFDPVQGGMPIVEGAPPARGATLFDGDSGLPVFSSAGGAAQHGVFKDLAFDVRISMAQLTNVLRIVTARQTRSTPQAVTAEQLAATWGGAWSDPAQWSLVTVAVGQEVHNPYADGNASVGGAFSSLYVGPQP